VASYRSSGGSSKGLYYAGLALYHMEYYTDATTMWAQLATERPKEPIAETAFFKAARTQFELGHTTTAVNGFIQFAMAYPNSAYAKEARLQAGHALFNAGQLNEAASYYADYLKRYPTPDDMATITPYLAACYAHAGKSPSDADALMRGLPPTDVYAFLRWDKGSDQYNAKNYAGASQLYGELAFDTPANENASGARFYRGESLFEQKQWRDAEAAYHGFIVAADQANENVPVAYFHQGVAQFNQDHLLKAAKTFQALADAFPSHPLAADAIQNMLICYNNLGDWETRDRLRQQYHAPDIAAAQAPAAVPAGKPASRRTVAELVPNAQPFVSPQKDMNLAQSPVPLE
jgi:TolA-binding protein